MYVEKKNVQSRGENCPYLFQSEINIHWIKTLISSSFEKNMPEYAPNDSTILSWFFFQKFVDKPSHINNMICRF